MSENRPSGRVPVSRHVNAVMSAAGIEEGPHRCPKGLRHGYAIHALSKAVPLNLVSKWMGPCKDGNHSDLRQRRRRGTTEYCGADVDVIIWVFPQRLERVYSRDFLSNPALLHNPGCFSWVTAGNRATGL